MTPGIIQTQQFGQYNARSSVGSALQDGDFSKLMGQRFQMRTPSHFTELDDGQSESEAPDLARMAKNQAIRRANEQKAMQKRTAQDDGSNLSFSAFNLDQSRLSLDTKQMKSDWLEQKAGTSGKNAVESQTSVTDKNDSSQKTTDKVADSTENADRAATENANRSATESGNRALVNNNNSGAQPQSAAAVQAGANAVLEGDEPLTALLNTADSSENIAVETDGDTIAIDPAKDAGNALAAIKAAADRVTAQLKGQAQDGFAPGFGQNTFSASALKDLLGEAKGEFQDTLTNAINSISSLAATSGASFESALRPAGAGANGITTSIPTSFYSADWKDMFSDRVEWILTQKIQEATIKLNPVNLGPIEVSVRIEDGQTSATFYSQNPQVREAIEASLPRLEQMLSNVGLSLGDTQVAAETFRGRDDNPQSFTPRNSGTEGVDGIEGVENDIAAAYVSPLHTKFSFDQTLIMVDTFV